MDDVIALPLDDPRYPKPLTRIVAPPAVLFVRGDVAVLRESFMVAVVGTRRMTRYGETVAGRVAASLARSGACVVSGLALGIDAAAHAACLAAGGKTVAVLPGGVARKSVVPRSNATLAERIVAAGGALVSEHSSGVPPLRHTFLLRNRIVAGLCRAVAVIEAPEKSGALATARLAMETGRDVFAVPGHITSQASAGTNLLIAAGAIPLLHEGAVPDYYGLAPRDIIAEMRLSPEEIRALEAVQDGAANVDVIAEKTGLSIAQTLAALAALELVGAVARDGAGYVSTLTKRRSLR